MRRYCSGEAGQSDALCTNGPSLSPGRTPAPSLRPSCRPTEVAMAPRTAAMYREMGCFAACVCGWILVISTMPTEYWTYSEIGSLALTTSIYFSNLWKDCILDSTGATDCKVIPSLLALDWHIHMCRALVITAVILGFLAAVLALVGMKCTKLGGSETVNARVTLAAGLHYLFAGLCSISAFSFFGNKIRAEFQDPNYRARKSELGAALFVGWGGSTLLIVGGLVMSIFAGKEGCESSFQEKEGPVYHSSVTYFPTPGKQAYYMTPQAPEDRLVKKSRPSRTSMTFTSSINAYV